MSNARPQIDIIQFECQIGTISPGGIASRWTIPIVQVSVELLAARLGGGFPA